MLWITSFLVNVCGAQRHSCAELLARPDLYAGNRLVANWVMSERTHDLALRNVPLRTMITLIAFYEHQGVYVFSPGLHERPLANELDQLRTPNGTIHLSGREYAYLTEQNPVVTDWIRRKLSLYGLLTSYPTMEGTLIQMFDDAREARVPERIPIVPLFERRHAPAPDGEQLSLFED